MLKIMVANKVGALAVTDGTGEVVGIVSERDYLSKVAFLGKTSDETTVKEISTYGIDNIVSVSQGNPIERCMEKLLGRDVRHLLIREEKSHKSPIVGMISVKDIVKCAHEKSKAQMNRMEEVRRQFCWSTMEFNGEQKCAIAEPPRPPSPPPPPFYRSLPTRTFPTVPSRAV